MKKICYFIVLLPFYLSAQNNESDTLKWKASLDLTGIYQEGNVETAIFRAKAKVEYRPWKKWLFKTQNSYVYQEFGKQKADEDILSLNFLYFNPERRVYPQLLGFASTNFRRRIDLRYLLGAGVTFKILDQEKYALKVSLSSEYEQTDFRTDIFNREAYNGNSSIHTFRSTIWIQRAVPTVRQEGGPEPRELLSAFAGAGRQLPLAGRPWPGTAGLEVPKLQNQLPAFLREYRGRKPGGRGPDFDFWADGEELLVQQHSVFHARSRRRSNLC